MSRFLLRMLIAVALVVSLAASPGLTGAAPRFPSGVPGSGLLVEPDQGVSPVVQFINGAKQSVYVVIYELDDVQVLGALKAAAARKLQVRVMLEPNPQGAPVPPETIRTELQSAGVSTSWSNPKFHLTHQKTIIIDEALALVMTMNLSTSAFSKNREFGVVVNDPAMVREIVAVFNADWLRKPVAISQPNLAWCPVNARPKELAIINGAKRTLVIYNEEMQDVQLEEAIAAAARRGVRVRVVMSNGPGTPNVRGERIITRGGAQLRLIAIPYIHAKVVLADAGGAGAIAYIGSSNISTASLNTNRELGVIDRNPAHHAIVMARFERDWSAAKPYRP